MQSSAGRKRVRRGSALLAACAASLIGACGIPSGWESAAPKGTFERPGYTAYFDPVPDSELGGNGTAVRFFSTDVSCRGAAGYSFWMYGDVSVSANEAGGILYRAAVDRISGNPAAGFGIVFAVQEGGASFYVLLIDTEGNWELGQVTDRIFTAMGDGWAPGGGVLKTGYNQVNEIGVHVTASAAGIEITPLLNGTPMPPVGDEDATVFSRGAFGFIVTTAPTEPSPTNPVDVRFAPILPPDLGLKEAL